MRKVVLISVLILLATIGASWKLRILEPFLWRTFLAAGPAAKTISKPFVKVRPAGLPGRLLNQNRNITLLIGGPVDKDSVTIHISKSRYKLTVLYKNKPIKEYPIVLGSDPTGDKVQKGDKRTPEGRFKVRGLYPNRYWSKFIWLDYPNKESWKKHDLAKANGEIAAGAAIGGEVGIHGVPAGSDRLVDEGVNWTAGCISLKTKDVDELYSVLEAGTPVVISH